jgi:hypothetical protein
MEYRGTFEDGIVRPDGPVELPDGTPVEFHAAGPRRMERESSLELDPRYGAFTDNLSVDELAARQGVHGPVDWSRFKSLWPEDESIDEFLEQVRQGRR